MATVERLILRGWGIGDMDELPQFCNILWLLVRTHYSIRGVKVNDVKSLLVSTFIECVSLCMCSPCDAWSVAATATFLFQPFKDDIEIHA